MRDRSGEKRERLLLARVREARLGGEAARVLLRVLRRIAHDGEREQVVHAREAHVEVARMAPAPRVEQEHLHATAAERGINGLPDRIHARTSEHGHVDRLALREARHGLDAVRLLDDRDETVLAVKDQESVREAVDQRLLPVFHLGDGYRAARDRLDQRVHRKGQFGEFVVPPPVEARTVRLAAVLARLPHAVRHLRQRVEQQPALEPEDGQDENDADDAHKERQPSNGGPRRV